MSPKYETLLDEVCLIKFDYGETSQRNEWTMTTRGEPRIFGWLG